MKTLVLAATKGGSGKTTLAAHLAVCAQLSDDGPVTLLDLDPQRNLTAWWTDRENDTPEMSEVLLDEFRAEIAAAKSHSGILIVDTPRFEAVALSEILKEADFVIIPVQPSPNDLRAVAKTVETVKESGKPFCFVITRGTARSNLTQQAPMVLSEFGPVATTIIFNRVSYADAMTDGRTAQEIDPKGKAAAEVISLWGYVKAKLQKEKL